MVDWVPIRTFRNHADRGVPFPSLKPMMLVASIWNGESWATNGGKDKINWAYSPFSASFQNYKIDACKWKGSVSACSTASPTNWWNNGTFSSLTGAQRRLLKWVRVNYLNYDYCQDNKRFNNSLPKECSLPPY
ncbi:Probable xyloglucan endotransglucosylase/hydrolase protein 10 [Striga hermonthica]|uniref:xyloglucan:xyloglucosyl transferase n=1 Tax=Striga hermonthica TaxID=68872 RepID=A0A9N7MJZ8_STRHE|nr:Probable xyloglucan endotransglucosylase/hydrolase protein 10 [Striga hermonthica]